MFLVGWMVLGLVTGAILSWVAFRGDRAHAADMALGAFGALVGGFVYNVTSTGRPAQYHPWSVVAALVGATAMLAAFHALRRTGHG